LRAGRIDEALEVAAPRLRSSGRVPVTDDLYWRPERGTRLAAALLIPIGRASAAALARLVLRPQTQQEDEE
jgi:CRISPR-associated protein Csx17